MGKSFFPYLDRYLVISKELMKFPYSRKIRKISIKSITASLKCCSDEDQMQQIINFCLPEILDILNYHTKLFFLRDIKGTLKTFIEAFEHITNENVIDLKIIEKIYENLKNILIKVEEKKQKYKLGLKEKHDADENDMEHIEQDMEVFNEVNRSKKFNKIDLNNI